ncbi:MAG: hypothetical protein KF886_15900 [Candidatus Hydrogenedentes bacterium]|nr:hypothetical protein [Candidatus Hydrogenedentota bacterium]
MHEPARRTPRWAWALILGLAATQPLLYGITRLAPPEATVPTGLTIPDSALFLHSLDMFPSGFHSNYAACQAPEGDSSLRYYSVPHLWLYGVLGPLVRALPGDALFYYALANGLGALALLWAVHRFLIEAIPRHANAAFVLFALSGGPGGLLFLLSGLAGLHAHPDFDALFFRFGVYDLFEGAHGPPVLYYPRLYYTLSLAGCLGGLGAALRAARGGGTVSPAWMAAIGVAGFLNARFAVFSFGLLALFVLFSGARLDARAARALGRWAIPAAAGVLCSALLMRLNPATVENHQTAGAMAIWFSPFVIATGLHWVAAWPAIARGWRVAPARTRVLLGAGMGYLAAYAIGYVVYQTYHGNLLAGRDGSVAAAISDPALLGALAGAAWAWRRRGARETTEPDETPPWILVALIGFTALALSGFGQGWFLRFGPQRIQVLLWLPLCMAAAAGLAHWRMPAGRAIGGALVGMGVLSAAVALLFFQSPLGRAGAAGPYPALHTEVMHVDDAALMERIGGGTVLAPAPASDVIALRRGNPVVYGIGSFNLTTVPHARVRGAVETFFDPATPDAEREAIAREWCAAWIYCPATWPVPEATRTRLAAAAWLEQVADRGAGMLLRVREAASR